MKRSVLCTGTCDNFMGKLVGVDIGGTFTDIVVLDENQKHLQIGKASTTPHEPSIGLINWLGCA